MNDLKRRSLSCGMAEQGSIDKPPLVQSISIQVTRDTDDEGLERKTDSKDSSSDAVLRSPSQNSDNFARSDESSQSNECEIETVEEESDEYHPDYPHGVNRERSASKRKRKKKQEPSRIWLGKLKKSKSAKDIKVRALTSPEAEGPVDSSRWRSSFGQLLKAVPKDVVSRSKSLENHARRPHSNTCPESRHEDGLKTKTKLFKSLTSLEKPSANQVVGQEGLELNTSSDNSKSPSSRSKFLKNPFPSKKSNGHVKANTEFAWKVGFFLFFPEEVYTACQLNMS